MLLPDEKSGYVLDGAGNIHAFGGAPSVSSGPTWSGWDVAVGVSLAPNGSGVKVDTYRRAYAFAVG